ncbi:glycoside hydrolase family 73 protein [Trinickia fusca]|uniref:Mannosyl-glycoprotein endo-beta-N-acetylglucosamidase n=1 Tax=Trinickia fusca TaxID=2419777 RepID=A0A494XQP4_9BURK|nr:glucosaminidase domain-containing protein [Trinickia fusca]RKP50499.1 mannosyl-glycoprotein endo-beta-N-acetylglucosamidase [Trinickia fusca]
MSPQDFIASLAPAARASAENTRIPASFVVAEGALESGWGTSRLAVEGFNLFGVKADASWHGPVLAMPTREYLGGQWVMVPANWRKYGDWLGSITDHASFLLENPRYQPAFACTSGAAFAEAIAKAGYATDPQYAAKIASIIGTHGLDALDVPDAAGSDSATPR